MTKPRLKDYAKQVLEPKLPMQQEWNDIKQVADIYLAARECLKFYRDNSSTFGAPNLWKMIKEIERKNYPSKGYRND